jgi:gas vesicle protein
MRLIVGLFAGAVIGVAAGVAAVVAYAVSSDQDVREVFAKARKNMESIDLVAVGAQVQQGIADAGTLVQENISKATAKAEQAAESTTSEIAENGADVVDAITETEQVAPA